MAAAVARAQQRTLEQHRSDAVALPGLLDAEGGFRLVREWRTDAPQFGGAAQNAVDEETVHHHAKLVGRCGMTRNDLVRHRTGKAPAPAVMIETEQVVAIGVGLTDPQFADGAAIGQRLVHFKTP